MIIYIRIGIRYIFVRNYNFTYMIMDNLTMSWFWYPNQWRLFISILIPKPIRVIHWYSDTQPMGVIYWFFDTQTNGDCSLVFWYPNQLGLFIGTLILKPMGVIYWYLDTQANGGYSLVLWYLANGRLFIGTLMLSHGDIAWP